MLFIAKSKVLGSDLEFDHLCTKERGRHECGPALDPAAQRLSFALALGLVLRPRFLLFVDGLEPLLALVVGLLVFQQLFPDPPHLVTDGLLGDAQVLGDLLLGEARFKEPHDPDVALG